MCAGAAAEQPKAVNGLDAVAMGSPEGLLAELGKLRQSLKSRDLWPSAWEGAWAFIRDDKKPVPQRIAVLDAVLDAAAPLTSDETAVLANELKGWTHVGERITAEAIRRGEQFVFEFDAARTVVDRVTTRPELLNS